MAVGYLDSNSLIDTIKREAMIPTNQSTFQNSDFWAMANQELRISLVPQVIASHQEYFVRDSAPIPIVANQNNYPIPYRAVGSKFRDVYYLDTNGNLRSMTRISPDDRPYYQQSNFQNRFIYFFIQGNDVVIVPEVGSNPTGYLIFSFYMRPNELVDPSRVSTIQGITINGMVGSVSTAPYGTIIPDTYAGGVGSNSTFADFNNTNVLLNVANTNNLVANMSVSGNGIPVNTIVQSVVGTTVTLNNNVSITNTQQPVTFNSTITFTVDQIPQNVAPFVQNGALVSGFSTSSVLDQCQTKPGHRILAYDRSPILVDTTNLKITFNSTDVSPLLVLGDYISFAGECIIPNIPSDLHDVLAQRVVTRCLLALGDQAGYGMAAQKLTDMQQNANSLINNRSEGEPQKINNLRGCLRSAKIRKRGWI